MKRNCFLGAIVGDIAGSVYEFDNNRTKDFELFADWHGKRCFVTDDSIMTIAIGRAMADYVYTGSDVQELAKFRMRETGQPYPYCGYGGRFAQWMYSDNPQPYNSFGNGAAMRVSAVAYVANAPLDVVTMSRQVTEVTHNHPEGIKGAEATAMATWYALHGAGKKKIQQLVEENYYKLNFMIDQIRPTYKFNETCQDTVPQAIEAFLESDSFEDAIKTAISVGGDSDTLAAITGAIAGAYYGVPDDIAAKARCYLDSALTARLESFEGIIRSGITVSTL